MNVRKEEVRKERDKNIKGYLKILSVDCAQDFSMKYTHKPLVKCHLSTSLLGFQEPSISQVLKPHLPLSLANSNCKFSDVAARGKLL